MKQIIGISCILLLAGMAFSSCKKSSINNSIVGNWELTSLDQVVVDSTTTPVSSTTFDTTLTHGHSQVISFFADNTETQYSFFSTPVTIQSNGTYIILSDSLTLFTGSSTTGQTFYFTVGGNSLTININTSNPGLSSTSITEKFNRQ
jgi:hypothetical protein